MAQNKYVIDSGFKVSPIRIFIFGEAKIGKSTFIAEAPDSLLIDLENGSERLDVKSRISNIKNFDAFLEVLEMIKEDDSICPKFIGIDTMDRLESMINDHVCVSMGVDNVGRIPHGQGYSLATTYLEDVLNQIEVLRTSKQINFILTAHAVTKTIDSPDTEPYDRWVPNMREKNYKLIVARCDLIGFCSYKIFAQEVKETKSYQGKTDGRRVMYSEFRPAFEAGNRIGIPFEIDFNFRSFAQHYKNHLDRNQKVETTTEEGN